MPALMPRSGVTTGHGGVLLRQARVCTFDADPSNAVLTVLASFVLGAVLLALALFLHDLVQDRVSRRRSRIGRRLEVVVLVDRRRRGRRRSAFWRRVLHSDRDGLRHRTRVTYISVGDEVERNKNPANRLFSTDRTDVIIINWDAMNGDPVYRADTTQAFLMHYRPDLAGWLSRGGVLIVESQGVSWGPADSPYAALAAMFPDSGVATSSGMWTLGKKAAVNERCRQNPVASGLTDEDLEIKPGGLWEQMSWFPGRWRIFHRRVRGRGIDSIHFIRRHQSHLYRGWFESWSSDWRPVLIADDPALSDGKLRPVLLERRVRPVESPASGPAGGAIVLSTMFIASSELYRLIANLIDLADQPDAHDVDLSPPAQS